MIHRFEEQVELKAALQAEVREFVKEQEQRAENAIKSTWEAAYRSLGVSDEVRIWREYKNWMERE